MENCCLNCKHFDIWDGDPCCLEKDEWKIVLPSMICEKYKEEIFKPALKLREEEWESCKKDFFNRYQVNEDLKKRYLELFPE
jgi:hypothetical protein